MRLKNKIKSLKLWWQNYRRNSADKADELAQNAYELLQEYGVECICTRYCNLNFNNLLDFYSSKNIECVTLRVVVGGNYYYFKAAITKKSQTSDPTKYVWRDDNDIYPIADMKLLGMVTDIRELAKKLSKMQTEEDRLGGHYPDSCKLFSFRPISWDIVADPGCETVIFGKREIPYSKNIYFPSAA